MTAEADLRRAPLPLRGRVAVITGVSRVQGIGYATACRLVAYGASVFVQHHQAHDDAMPWGADNLDDVLTGIREHRADSAARVEQAEGDFADPESPERLMRMARDACGHVDILVCNHATSERDGALGELDAASLDRHWAINARSSLLLTQAFAVGHDGREGGRVVLLTSGQQQGPMPGQIGYAAAKGALAEITVTLADQLADAGITLNTVNPGPVQTGYLDDATLRSVAPMFPFGRCGEPDDPARLIAWLVTDEARWVTGQVINTEGGFARWRPRAD